MIIKNKDEKIILLFLVSWFGKKCQNYHNKFVERALEHEVEHSMQI